MYYLDTSAAVKLLIKETGSDALRSWLVSREGAIFSGDLLRTELLRAIRRAAPELMMRARALLHSIPLLKVPTAAYQRAATLEPGSLRSLDALHLATALEVGEDLQGVITYDHRLAEGARYLGIEVFTVLQGR